MDYRLKEKITAYKNTWREMRSRDRLFLLAMIVVGVVMLVTGSSMVCNS